MKSFRIPGLAGRLAVAFSTAALLAAASGNALAQTGPGVNRLIVQFQDAPSAVAASARSAMARAVIKAGASRAGVSLDVLRQTGTGAEVVQIGKMVTHEEAYRIIGKLLADPAVKYAEPDLLMQPAFTPNDPRYNEQWHYSHPVGGINVPAAWDETLGSGVVVAVLDTGYRPHADLADNLLPGYDFVSDSFMGNDGDGRDADASDPGDAVAQGGCGFGFPEYDTPSSWHGTHVAGTIAALGNNGIGVTGVAPQAKVLPLRVLGKCGGYTSDIIDAMLWAVGQSVPGVPANPHPAQVVNLSLGSPVPTSCPSSYGDAIAAIRAAGALPVFAAGNEGGNADTYPPGNCAGAFTVAAVDKTGGRAFYSNFGSVVALAAPGGAQVYPGDPNGILSTANQGSDAPGADHYAFYQGTSMAAPHVAGVAALLYAAGVADAAAVESLLLQSVRAFPDTCTGCGAGIVDVGTAIGIFKGDINPAERTNLTLVLKGDSGKFKKIEGEENLGYIQYVATVTNSGPNAVNEVVVQNHYPDEVTLNTISITQGSCDAGGVICELGSMAVGVEATIVINVLTSNKQKMDFMAEVQSELLDADTSDNFVLKRFGGALGLLLPLLLALTRVRLSSRVRLSKREVRC
jgi:serine protease